MNPGAKLDVALVRLGEIKSSCGKLLGDCLKLVCGLFEACHIACFGGYCGRFCEHTICHIWFDIESVITYLCNNMCGFVDLMKC